MARNPGEEGIDPLQLGRMRYRDKDFKGALQAFSEAVRISSNHLLLQALDHRAGTYEKLDQLQAALRDSQQMLKLKPDSAKGYLRCGKVLQLRGEIDLAFKIYERGLKKVKIGMDDERLMLQRMYNKLKDAQEPTKTRDPLLKLPTELAKMVCSYLNQRDRQICLSVSRKWKQFLEASYDLWAILDMSSTKRAISGNSLSVHCRRSNYTLKQAILKMEIGKINPSKLKFLFRASQKLEYLELRNGIIGNTLLQTISAASNSLRTLVLKPDTLITLDCVTKVLANYPHLSTAEFHRIDPGQFAYRSQWPQMDRLETLVLNAQDQMKSDVNALSLDNLVLATPNLTSAIFYGWHKQHPQGVFDLSAWETLKHLELNKTSLSSYPILPSSLETLILCDTFSFPKWNSEPGLEFYPEINLPNLIKFDCTKTTGFPDQFIKRIVKPSIESRKLKVLRIGLRLDVFECSVNEFIHAPSVVDLSLAGSLNKEAEMEEILTNFPNLLTLDLSYTLVTGVVIKTLLKRENEEPLTLLRLNGCRGVSQDAVAYCRSKGTVVEYGLSEIGPPRYFRNLGQ